MALVEKSLERRIARFFNEMPFESQIAAEKFYRNTIILTAIISYIIGWLVQKFSVCVYSTSVVMIICFVIVVPGQMPWWKTKPLPFQPDPADLGEKKNK